jgi:hypothetical protein
MPLTARLACLESHRAFPGWKTPSETRVPRACRIARAPERRVRLRSPRRNVFISPSRALHRTAAASTRELEVFIGREGGGGRGAAAAAARSPAPFIEPVLFHARPPVALVNGFFALARAEERFAVCVAARCTRE